MAKQVKIYIVDPVNKTPPRLDNCAREIQESDVDTMRSVVRAMLEKSGMRVRSINFHTDGSINAYVYQSMDVGKSTKPLEGWVFKRPDLKPTT